MAYTGKHRGQPKAGYSRGSREKPESTPIHDAVGKPSSLKLGYMPPSQLMAMHTAVGQFTANRNAAGKSLAMYKHPSSGRNQAFLDSAETHVRAANNADARMSVANASVSSAEQFTRKGNFIRGIG